MGIEDLSSMADATKRSNEIGPVLGASALVCTLVNRDPVQSRMT